MPLPPQFLFDFKRTVEYVLGQIGGVSHRDFVRLYDYDDFLERQAVDCHSARELAIAFATRFLGSVSPAYFRALSLALVRFLARQSGRSAEAMDREAIKALAQIESDDLKQLDEWMRSYFPDVL